MGENENIATINEENLDFYVLSSRDSILFRGLAVFCSNDKKDKEYSQIKFKNFMLLPSPVKRKQYDYAINIHKEWNNFLHLCSNDHELIRNSLEEVIYHDDFIGNIWKICEQVHNEGEPTQPITFNINRFDYMLSGSSEVPLKNIELNTFAICDPLSTNIYEHHKYMLKVTENQRFLKDLINDDISNNLTRNMLKAWSYYGNSRACIAIIIDLTKIHSMEERALELNLYETEENIKVVRISLTDVFKYGKLDNEKKLIVKGDEIGLVYFTGADQPTDYPTDNEWAARLMIERSKAIKAPKIEYHLLGTKKFQEYISRPGIMEKYIKDKHVLDALRGTFVKLYSFGSDKDNKKLIEMMKTDYKNLVLKPQRECGGNNFFDEDIKKIAESISNEEELYKYVLMERIKPDEHDNYLVTQTKPVKKESCVAELGIIGLTIGDCRSNELISSEIGGYLIKTKVAHSNECGIFAGYGGYGSAYLID